MTYVSYNVLKSIIFLFWFPSSNKPVGYRPKFPWRQVWPPSWRRWPIPPSECPWPLPLPFTTSPKAATAKNCSENNVGSKNKKGPFLKETKEGGSCVGRTWRFLKVWEDENWKIVCQLWTENDVQIPWDATSRWRFGCRRWIQFRAVDVRKKVKKIPPAPVQRFGCGGAHLESHRFQMPRVARVMFLVRG